MGASVPVKQLVFNASELAAAIGRHRHQPQHDMLLKYVKAIDPTAHARLAGYEQRRVSHGVGPDASPASAAVAAQVSHTLLQVPQDRRERGRILFQGIRSEMPQRVQRAVACAAGAGAGGCDEVQHAAMDACAAVDAYAASHAHDLTADDVAAIKEHCRSSLFGAFGTAQEGAAVRGFAAEAHAVVSKDDVYRKRHVLDVRFGDREVPVLVGGKCDGLAAGPDGGAATHLVEVKNRIYRLFGAVPEYERIQVTAYLYIYGLTNGTLVERFRDRTACHAIEFDQEFWDATVLPGLRDAAHRVLQMCSSTDGGSAADDGGSRYGEPMSKKGRTE